MLSCSTFPLLLLRDDVGGLPGLVRQYISDGLE